MAVGLLCAVVSLTFDPVQVTAADTVPDSETYTWNLEGATYIAPVFFSSETTMTKYPSNGGAYTVGAIQGTDAGTELIGRGPHGGYDTTTMKCQTCHSPHGADYEGSNLLRVGSTGCEYCHLGSSVATSKSVYLSSNGNPYDLESVVETASGHQLGTHENVPDSSLAGFDLSCGSCHSVHAADSELWKPTDFFQDSDPASPTVEMSTLEYGYKLLKADPSGNGITVATSSTVSNPTTDPLTVNQFASAAWCMDCHDASMSDGQELNTDPGYLGLTESFETTSFTFIDGTITYGTQVWNTVEDECGAPRKAAMEGLYNGPSQCYNCHRGGLQPIADGLDPNDTTQAALLAKIEGSGEKYQQNMATDADRIDCSTCHYAPADFAADDYRRNGTADWPHSSSNDYALLGDWTIDPSLEPTQLAVMEIPGGMTETNIPQYVCGRCHPTTDGVNFIISSVIRRHYELSIQNVVTQDTAGLLGTFYSPGWDSPGWPRP